jgi:hypothetical protein
MVGAAEELECAEDVVGTTDELARVVELASAFDVGSAVWLRSPVGSWRKEDEEGRSVGDGSALLAGFTRPATARLIHRHRHINVLAQEAPKNFIVSDGPARYEGNERTPASRNSAGRVPQVAGTRYRRSERRVLQLRI